MPNLPRDWNPEQAGSRFTSRASLAILSRPNGASRYAEGSDTGPTEDVIADALGPAASALPGLGQGRAVDGSYGRGASGWVPVIEWTAQAAIAGVVGAAAVEALKNGARELHALTERLRAKKVDFLVSRGTAALLAIDHILRSSDESDILDVEAVEEPSMLNGDPATELGFVGSEPWLVSLLNAPRTARYLVAVSPSGQILGVLRLPIGEFEQLYLRVP